jgi:hypothetical protein
MLSQVYKCDYFPTVYIPNPAHHEGVSGGVRRRSRMRRPRIVPRTHGTRAAPGTRPGTLRSPATGSLTDGGGARETNANERPDEKRGPGRRLSAATERRKAPAGSNQARGPQGTGAPSGAPSPSPRRPGFSGVRSPKARGHSAKLGRAFAARTKQRAPSRKERGQR